MNKTKIDWAEMSWNPVTGCRHGCPYCYARRTAHRFDAGMEDSAAVGGLHVLESKIKATPYPYGFEPTLHRYRLNRRPSLCVPWRTCLAAGCRRSGSGTWWTPARERPSTDTCF